MRTACLCLLALIATLPTGCRTIQLRPSLAARDAVASSATKDEVVALVNRNITGQAGQGGLISWRCMQAKFQMPPMPGWAPGTLIVEAPRNFRLRVSHPIGGGDMLDVGSNPDEFWIWQKDMQPPYLLTSRHDDLPLALQQFKVPFQPDWITEVLGVIPIDGSRYELHPTPGKPYMELVANSVSPSGEAVRKVIRVDTRRGWVQEHLLWGAGGRLIASAELSDHRIDPATKLITPRKIRIHWPEADLDLKVTLDHIEVNPTDVPPVVWQVPQKPGYKRVDMGALARQRLSPAEIQQVELELPQRTGDLPRGGVPPGGATPGGVQPAGGAMPVGMLPVGAASAPAPFPDLSQAGAATSTSPPPFPATPPDAGALTTGTPLPVRTDATVAQDQPPPGSGAAAPLSPPGRVRLSNLAP